MDGRDAGPRSSNGAQERALALSGGGFLSLASFTGLTSVLLRAREERPTMVTSGMFSSFGTLSTVSGGTWFLAELAYSPSFRKLVEDMAASPETAGDLFIEHWAEPWIARFKGTGGFQTVLAKIAELFGKEAIVQDIKLVGFLWETGLTWSNFVRQLLESTAKIRPGMQLGAPVEDWARGKAWLIGHSLVTPSADVPGALAVTAAGSTRYTADLPVPLYIPAKFSITLGSGPESNAPFPYCAESAIGADCRLHWETPVGGCWCSSQYHTAASEPVGRFANFTEKAGSLPLAPVVACSSSFLGGFVLSEFITKIETALQGVFPVWGSLTAGSEAFATADTHLSKILGTGSTASVQVCDSLADNSVCALIDGAYTENSGIAHAVATGSTEITTIHSTDLEDMFHLFQGAGTEEGSAVRYLYFPIFEEHHSQIREQAANFSKLVMPDDTQLLQGVTVGTLQVTTAQSDAFGIPAGRAVTLHVLHVSSSLTIGLGVDFRDYGKKLGILVREFSAALDMPQNAGLVDKILGMVV